MEFSYFGSLMVKSSVFLDGIRKPRYVRGLYNCNKKTRGVIILAGGVSHRLFLNESPYPKGCLRIYGKALYQILLEKFSGRVAIMTSKMTYHHTKEWLQKHNYHHIDVFQQTCDRRLLKRQISPGGNGSLFSSFRHSSLWNSKKWKNVDVFHVIPVDNPSAVLVHNDDVDVSILAVEKRHEREELGTILEKEGRRLCIREYSEMPFEGSEEWLLGYTGIFSCSKEFFDRSARICLPWHFLQRNGVRYKEQFLFDAFPTARSYRIFVEKRERIFTPIKYWADVSRVYRMMG